MTSSPNSKTIAFTRLLFESLREGILPPGLTTGTPIPGSEPTVVLYTSPPNPAPGAVNPAGLQPPPEPGSGYSPQTVSFAPPSSTAPPSVGPGVFADLFLWNDTEIRFGPAEKPWGTISHWGLMLHGIVIYVGQFSAPKPIGISDEVRIAPETLVIAED